MPTTAPYGTWTSPVSAHTVAGAAVRLSQPVVERHRLYWVEGRPREHGRNVIVSRGPEGRLADVTPVGTNVRTRVHEYGGAAYTVSEGTVYYSEFTDQRIYRLNPGGSPEPLTPPGAWRYADARVDPARRRLIAVREDHTIASREAVNTLVSLPLDGAPSAGRVIVSDQDFYSNPRLSADGSRLTWLAWNHPQMPWDGTELWIGDVASDGGIEHPQKVAGGESEAILQPEWSPSGTLCFISDRSGWWNFYRLHDGQVAPIHSASADFGRPPWQIGTSMWAFSGSSRLVAARAQGGRWRLVTIDVDTGALAALTDEIEPAEGLTATDTHAVIVGGAADVPDAVMRVDLTSGAVEMVREASETTLNAAAISRAEAIEFPTDDGLTAHAFFYTPRNPEFDAPVGERPPLIVIAHGGPTGAANARLSLEVQFWTSRGFAVVDVNYAGSTGYGRAYRQRLRGRWGVGDLADCVNAVRYLVAGGRADPDRLIVRGRSAGGYTALMALTCAPDVFKAGASYYGIADLELMVEDTHKFESRYLDSLVGPYPADRAVYRERSPIHHVDRLSCALILFQGLDDRVVPPNQARAMADAVRAKGLPVSLVTFAGEQHGFRQAANIVRCLEAELFFYGAVFGFRPAGPAPEVEMDNL